jgi:hypothetical protein
MLFMEFLFFCFSFFCVQASLSIYTSIITTVLFISLVVLATLTRVETNEIIMIGLSVYFDFLSFTYWDSKAVLVIDTML